MVVFLHDETCSSEWCRFEWQVAMENNIPVVCLVDIGNCLKRIVLDQVQETEPYLLGHQLIEYSLKSRRGAVKEVAMWLNDLPRGGVIRASNSANHINVDSGVPHRLGMVPRATSITPPTAVGQPTMFIEPASSAQRNVNKGNTEETSYKPVSQGAVTAVSPRYSPKSTVRTKEQQSTPTKRGSAPETE